MLCTILCVTASCGGRPSCPVLGTNCSAIWSTAIWRGQCNYQVSVLLHWHVLTVCLGKPSDQQAQDWTSQCHCSHTGWYEGAIAGNTDWKGTEICTTPFQCLLKSRAIHFSPGKIMCCSEHYQWRPTGCCILGVHLKHHSTISMMPWAVNWANMKCTWECLGAPRWPQPVPVFRIWWLSLADWVRMSKTWGQFAKG